MLTKVKVMAIYYRIAEICPIRTQLGHHKVTLVLEGPLEVSIKINLSVSEAHFVLQISQPPVIAHTWFYIHNLHMDLSFQMKKTV